MPLQADLSCRHCRFSSFGPAFLTPRPLSADFSTTLSSQSLPLTWKFLGHSSVVFESTPFALRVCEILVSYCWSFEPTDQSPFPYSLQSGPAGGSSTPITPTTPPRSHPFLVARNSLPLE